MIAILLHLLLAMVGLVAVVAPLAVCALRELAPASQPWLEFALAGGGRR